MTQATLHLIDGHSQVFRAYHAISGGLSNSAGLPTNATFGFLMGLNVLFKQERPTHLLVAFDAGHAQRAELYPAYKSNRAETPPDLLEQMPHIERALKALGIPVIRVEGCEADDLIATITRQARAQGFDVAIVSNDKDLFQLVDDHVTVLRTQPREGVLRCDRSAVLERMGVEPTQIADFLALTGDSTDCIPGVPGVGPKTAAKLLSEHRDLESVLAAAGSIPQPRLRSSLQENAEGARLSRRLATLDFNTPVTFDAEACAWTFRPNPDLTALLKEMEFNALLQEWGEPTPGAETKTEAITERAALEAFVARARRAPLLAVDTETSDVDEMRADLVGISLSCEKGRAVYIPIGHTALDGATHGQLDLDVVREVLGPLLADPAVPKVGHHLKFDLKILHRHGLPLRGIAFDSLLASYCLNPDKRAHGLKDLTLEHLGVAQTKISELIGTGKNQISFAEVPLADAAPYAGQDADLTLQLAEILRRELEKSDLLDLFLEIEVPLIEVLADMEMAGVAIDPRHFAALHAELERRLADLTREIHDLAGHEFKINSPVQLRRVLFEELQLPASKRGKTGHSTDVDVLESLAALHPLPAKILEHRQVEKLLSTYVDALPRLVNPRTDRIHTTFNQAIAATGRLSSSDPNLQNIPVRSELGRRIRQGFVPRAPENVFLAADYSQIELRVLAHLTGDPALIEAFRSGADIHRATAARVHGIRPEEVTSDQRAAAKVVTFGILYGISAHRLSIELGIERSAAQRLIDQYFASHPGVSAWMKRTLEEARERGFVTTLSGRRRFISDIRSTNFNLRAAAERVAVNTPVQGSAADMIKIAMLRIAERLAHSDLRALMVLQVHDELIFDLPREEVEALRPIVVETMAGALPLTVPVVVDVAVGATWAEC
jgi:DNA polymerase-1